MTVEESNDKKGAHPAPNEDLESAKNKQAAADLTEVVIEKPKKKWFQKRK